MNKEEEKNIYRKKEQRVLRKLKHKSFIDEDEKYEQSCLYINNNNNTLSQHTPKYLGENIVSTPPNISLVGRFAQNFLDKNMEEQIKKTIDFSDKRNLEFLVDYRLEDDKYENYFSRCEVPSILSPYVIFSVIKYEGLVRGIYVGLFKNEIKVQRDIKVYGNKVVDRLEPREVLIYNENDVLKYKEWIMQFAPYQMLVIEKFSFKDVLDKVNFYPMLKHLTKLINPTLIFLLKQIDFDDENFEEILFDTGINPMFLNLEDIRCKAEIPQIAADYVKSHENLLGINLSISFNNEFFVTETCKLLIGNTTLKCINFGKEIYTSRRIIDAVTELVKQSGLISINVFGKGISCVSLAIHNLLKVPVDQRSIPIISNSKEALQNNSINDKE